MGRCKRQRIYAAVKYQRAKVSKERGERRVEDEM
jgi:hypothetical protein